MNGQAENGNGMEWPNSEAADTAETVKTKAVRFDSANENFTSTPDETAKTRGQSIKKSLPNPL